MEVNYYRKVIQRKDQKDTGIILGLAIKDREIPPEAYSVLLLEAKQVGFKFVNIEFVK